MSTRSRIAIQNFDGTISSVYCHYDGYPEYNGKLLLQHYSQEIKVRALIALGDIISLGTEIGEEYKDRASTCFSFGRDGGSHDSTAYTSKNRVSFSKLADGCGAEYLYLFHNGAWMVKSVGSRFRKLKLKSCKSTPVP